jgi:hypothetical protein
MNQRFFFALLLPFHCAVSVCDTFPADRAASPADGCGRSRGLYSPLEEYGFAVFPSDAIVIA